MFQARILPALLLAILLASPLLAQRPYAGKVRSTHSSEMVVNGKQVEAEVENWGSFVIISPSHVLTNHHVVYDHLMQQNLGHESKLRIMFFEGTWVNAEVVAVEAIADLALLAFNEPIPDGAFRVAIARKFEPKTLTVCGYDMGQDYREVVANKYKVLSDYWFSFPGILKQGQSGSGIIDQDGKLCAVLWGSEWPDGRVGYGTRIEQVRLFLGQVAPKILQQIGN